MNDNYVDAYIYVKVPKWQIGQEALVYFNDTMRIKSICRELEPIEYSQLDNITSINIKEK